MIASPFMHSGFTPWFVSLQNDLEEFFAMVNFTNPGILGDAAYFRRYYEVSCCLIFKKLFIDDKLEIH